MPKLTYYCDDMRHLVCVPYTIANLHKMAKDLNIKRCWYHNPKIKGYAHYDIPKLRYGEISAKCTIISIRVLHSIIVNKIQNINQIRSKL